MQKNSLLLLFLFCSILKIFSQSAVKILFDARKAETAGNADWIVDADQWNLLWNPNATLAAANNEANAQRFPTPAQSLITASTPETFWTGSLSNWGIDCVKKGYQVETLPYNVPLTYGSSSNPQDLSNYKVYIVDEPNILFTAVEKIAMMQFIQNGGGLFLISDHTISDRNGDGNDSPVIWNDFISNNSILNNGLGFNFDLMNISQTSTNVITAPTDSILNGPAGNVMQVKWSNGTTMSLIPSQNPSVKGVIYTNGSTHGNTNVMCAYARVGAGKVAAIGDSSPPDDGTGDPNDVLYNGYTLDAAGNHQKLLMNITIWLALGGSSTTNIPELTVAPTRLFPNPSSGLFNINLNSSSQIIVTNIMGEELLNLFLTSGKQNIDLQNAAKGLYFLRIIQDKKKEVIKLIKE